jgi:hypothetical protein
MLTVGPGEFAHEFRADRSHMFHTEHCWGRGSPHWNFAPIDRTCSLPSTVRAGGVRTGIARRPGRRIRSRAIRASAPPPGTTKSPPARTRHASRPRESTAKFRDRGIRTSYQGFDQCCRVVLERCDRDRALSHAHPEQRAPSPARAGTGARYTDYPRAQLGPAARDPVPGGAAVRPRRLRCVLHRRCRCGQGPWVVPRRRLARHWAWRSPTASSPSVFHPCR